MQSVASDNQPTIFLPSCEQPLGIMARQLDEFSPQHSWVCTFIVTVYLLDTGGIDTHKTRRFQVVAHEVAHTHKRNEWQVKQILHLDDIFRSLTAAEAHQWLTGEVRIKRNMRGRILEELREAIAARLERQNIW